MDRKKAKEVGMAGESPLVVFKNKLDTNGFEWNINWILMDLNGI